MFHSQNFTCPLRKPHFLSYLSIHTCNLDCHCPTPSFQSVQPTARSRGRSPSRSACERSCPNTPDSQQPLAEGLNDREGTILVHVITTLKHLAGKAPSCVRERVRVCSTVCECVCRVHPTVL